MQRQSSLGTPSENRYPRFLKTDIGRVTGNADFEEFGIIQVILLDRSKPFPVWVVSEIERKPETGDHVLISYIAGRKDSPYLVGFVKNKNYTTNFVRVEKDLVRFQLPKFEIDVKDGDAHNNVKDKTLKDDKWLKQHRTYAELTPNHAIMSFPYDPNFAIPPAICELTPDYALLEYYFSPSEKGYVKITATSVDVYHPKAVNISGGDIVLSSSTNVITANGEDLTTDKV